ncbi:hypothetical protein QBC44DRAFT_374407 [Cladorrhinum sp. PSN332]|nr:hypothetical protein QBC44DRAFT_374407 [Cladorrhinum sp. PSN332]
MPHDYVLERLQDRVEYLEKNIAKLKREARLLDRGHWRYADSKAEVDRDIRENKKKLEECKKAIEEWQK